MNHPAYTKIERQVLDVCKSLGLPISKNPAKLSKRLRLTAYHEAAHVAARMFTGLEANHFLSVTIIPDSESDGIAKSDRNEAIWMLHTYPRPRKRTAGYCLLLMLLAGRGADARLDPWDMTDAADWAQSWGTQILDQGDADWETEGADLFHALRVARIMRHPRNDQIGRILHQAEQWTIEMLALPPVWASVEKIACMLLEHGTITDRDAISEACTEILYMGITTPKWQRRLVPTLAERKAMAGPLDR